MKIFIAFDFTRSQRKEQKKLHEALNLRRNNGEQVMIHNGQVIQRSLDAGANNHCYCTCLIGVPKMSVSPELIIKDFRNVD